MESPVYLKTRIASLHGHWKELYARHSDILMDP